MKKKKAVSKTTKQSSDITIDDLNGLSRFTEIKYKTIWENTEYRAVSVGEKSVNQAFYCLNCSPGESLVDYGCGTGRAAKQFALKGLKVTALDIADNCLDPEFQDLRPFEFKVGNIWNFPEMYVGGEYAYMVNVLEHLPEEKIGSALANIETHTSKAIYFIISTFPDFRYNQYLHLTVRPEYWWKQTLDVYFPSASYEVNAGQIHVYWRKCNAKGK